MQCNVCAVKDTLLFLVLGMVILFSSTALAFTVSLNVQGMPKVAKPERRPIGNYRWLIEEDTTNQPPRPFTRDRDTLAFSFYKSHAPVFAAGNQANAANISLPDGKRYFVSIVPDAGYTIGGSPIDPSAPVNRNHRGHLQPAAAAHGPDNGVCLSRQ